MIAEAEWNQALRQALAVWDSEQALKQRDNVFATDGKSDGWAPPSVDRVMEKMKRHG